MTERLTFTLFAVLHGDSEAITETDTWEAETKEDLVLKLADQLTELAEGIRKEVMQ